MLHIWIIRCHQPFPSLDNPILCATKAEQETWWWQQARFHLQTNWKPAASYLRLIGRCHHKLVVRTFKTLSTSLGPCCCKLAACSFSGPGCVLLPPPKENTCTWAKGLAGQAYHGDYSNQHTSFSLPAHWLESNSIFNLSARWFLSSLWAVRFADRCAYATIISW